MAADSEETGEQGRITSPELAGSPESVRKRRALGVAVVAGVVLLQIAGEVVAGHELARILSRFAFVALMLPVLMFALSAIFDRAIRYRFTASQGLLAGILIAMAIGILFGPLYCAFARHVPELRPRFPAGVSFSRAVVYGVINAELYFGLWALAFVYPVAIEGARIRALEAQHLRSEAELARLRAHLEPHFLLNTLNAIAGLVTEDPREARRLLVCMGDLLRDAVQETSDLQRLDKQVEWLQKYAQILEARHRGLLKFRWDVDADCRGELVPRLLLQPLVENAVKHGALRRGDSSGEVVVSATHRGDGTLVCVVADNGPGMPDAEVRQGAFGLQAVRRRIELEAPRASLRLESSSNGLRSIVEFAREA